MKTKYEIFGCYIFLIFSYFLFFDVGNPNIIYRNKIDTSSGFYFLTDVSNLKRGQNPIYPDNKYILYDESSTKKIVVNCSLLLRSCNVDNNLGQKVYVKYIKICSQGSCSNYLYEFKGAKSFDDTYFLNKYEAEVSDVNSFRLYFVFNALFIFLHVFLLRLKK